MLAEPLVEAPGGPFKAELPALTAEALEATSEV